MYHIAELGTMMMVMMLLMMMMMMIVNYDWKSSLSMITSHHRHVDTCSINYVMLIGDAPVAFNPPEVWLDLSDILISMDKLSLMTSNYQPSKSSSIDISPSTSIPNKDSTTSSSYANSVMVELYLLTERAWKNIYRTPELFYSRLVFFVIFSILLGTLFLFTKETMLGVQHRAAFFAFVTAGIHYIIIHTHDL